MKNKKILPFFFIFFFALSSHADNGFGLKLVKSAEKQIGVTRSYDPAYVRIAYPFLLYTSEAETV